MIRCYRIIALFFLWLSALIAQADEVTNGLTTLRVHLQGGRASSFELIEQKSNRTLAKIDLGFDTACALTPTPKGGALAFTFPDKESTITVELRESEPYPLLRFRLKETAALTLHTASAQILYRGGLEIPASSEAHPVPMYACPVPAAGLWDSANGVFVGFEAQEGRCARRSDPTDSFAFSDKSLSTSCRPAPPNGKGWTLVMHLPALPAQGRLRLIYLIDPSACPNEFVLKHIWNTYAEHLPPVPRVNDLGWLPARMAFDEDIPSPAPTTPYRNLAIYTGDPDPTDNLDPTFLIQSGTDRLSWGTVSWKETDKILCDMALGYIQTGDPVLKYFLQGALQRWPLGVESDGLHSIEILDVCGLGRVTRGMRLGLQRVGHTLAQYMQPIAPARLRVLCGRKQALAFSISALLSIAEYRCDEHGFAFTVTGDFSSPFTINITYPHRDLRGKKVLLNGNEVEAEMVGSRGENLVLKNVNVGDTVIVGRPESAPILAEPLPPVSTPPPEWNGYHLIDLPYDTHLDTSWECGLSWAGLVPGLHFAWGVPFRIAYGEKTSVDLSKRALSLNIKRKVGAIFLFAAATKTPLTMTATYADGKAEKYELTSHYLALVSPPLRSWRIEIFPLKLGRPDVEVERLEIAGDALVFALTTHPSTSPPCDASFAVAETQRRAVEKEIQAVQERRLAQERLVPDLRQKVTAATRGKLLRIGFVPPFGAGANVLRTACNLLGTPPVLLSPEAVIDPREFTPERYPIVVYAAFENFLHTVKEPGDAAQALTRYLASGGYLLAAAQGWPFFYPTRVEGDKYVKIPGLRHGELCATLEIFIGRQPDPKPDEILRYELVTGQRVFAHLPSPLNYDRTAGGPYRPITKEGLPPEDVFKPLIVLRDLAGNPRDFVAAEIEHNCKRYKGARVLFLWGNMLVTQIGQTIALDLMRHAICTAKLAPGPVREPTIAILPQDMAGHDKVIERACAAVGLKPQILKPEEFADPAIFNPHNFPVAIHAVEGEYFISKLDTRKDLAQIYIDYVKGGGFLLACGNMYQFYYARTILPDGKSRQAQDPDFPITTALGLQVTNSKFTDSRPMYLRMTPGQEIITFKSPMPIKGIPLGRYRAVNAAESSVETEFMPIAEVCNEHGESFGGYVIALIRFKPKELRHCKALWFCGDLLEDERTYPLLVQAVKYACQQAASVRK